MENRPVEDAKSCPWFGRVSLCRMFFASFSLFDASQFRGPWVSVIPTKSITVASEIKFLGVLLRSRCLRCTHQSLRARSKQQRCKRSTLSRGEWNPLHHRTWIMLALLDPRGRTTHADVRLSSTGVAIARVMVAHARLLFFLFRISHSSSVVVRPLPRRGCGCVCRGGFSLHRPSALGGERECICRWKGVSFDGVVCGTSAHLFV